MKYLYPAKPNEIALRHLDRYDRDVRWVGEVKKNGWRCLAEQGVLWTRHQTTIKESVKELREAVSDMLPPDTRIDGEFIHHRTKGHKAMLYVFDIMFYKGKLLAGVPFEERRAILEGVVVEGAGIELAKQVRVGKKALYHQSIGDELNEGIVLKKLGSKYLVSERRCLQNPFWLKVKKIEKHIII